MIRIDDNEIVAFQYWGSGNSGIYIGKEADEFREKHNTYREEGNTIASLFYGTFKEAKEQFPELFE